MLRFLAWLGVVLALLLSFPATGWCDPSGPMQYDCPSELSGAGDDDVPHIEQPPTTPIATNPGTEPHALRAKQAWSAGDLNEELTRIGHSVSARFAEILRWTRGWMLE